jgi:crossover junction endodeoxyribonuclease RuvC
LRRTGWGVIAVEGTRLSYVACGVIKSDEKRPFAERLVQLHEGLTAIIAAHGPCEAAVEETFVSKDARATLKLGHARGIALLAPALLGLPVAEYAANLIKKTVVGAGHAEKHQVEVMIRLLLPKADPKLADAADALAVAITHAHHRTRFAS